MLSRWPIRKKLLAGIALLLVILVTLFLSGIQGVYAYRGLAKSIRDRAGELPLATELAQHAGQLRMTLGRLQLVHDLSGSAAVGPPVGSDRLRQEFQDEFKTYQKTLHSYQAQLRHNRLGHLRIGDNDREQETVRRIEASLARITKLIRDPDWVVKRARVAVVATKLDQLHQLSRDLPSYLQERMRAFAGEVKLQYRAWIIIEWVTTISAILMLVLLVRLFYSWVVRPLRVLIEGSRRVAAGEFGHRIRLSTRDEMSELAQALNAMTDRFQTIRDDLDEQVKQRTKQVVRSEQLASVGFLAAGVAHEINNPLASIAMCAESLEGRLHDAVGHDDLKPDENHDEQLGVVNNYLRMIQDEAFRCKQITEKLLDFSRMGDVENHDTDLGSLVRDVVEMVSHLGKYRQKRIELRSDEPLVARINSQEIKQVVLNLITNALDSIDRGGSVIVHLHKAGCEAELVVADDGCGMTEEVLEHLFEPFFTRRRDGQGTGLGLSITYRIVTEHGGRIDAQSDGPGWGAKFRVTLPLAGHEKEHAHRYQVA